MSFLTWNHACSVGVRAMDDQHGILMDTINELGLLAQRGAGRERVTELLRELIQFTKLHFSSEEKLMEHYRFPGLASHRAEHQRMLARLVEGANAMQHGESVSMRTLLGSLRAAFLEHIEAFDQPYGPWLNAKGVF